MKKTWVACGVAGLVALVGTALSMGSAAALAPPAPRPPAPPAGTAPVTTNPTTAGGLTSSTTTNGVTVTISGGHETDARDGGRPVVLVAAALGVPTEVFRTAFSGVTPSRTGGPTEAEAQANKAALLRVLAPYGITNDRLDTVSNQYRYMGSAGQMWTNTLATATATVVNGRVTGITITNPGSGYSSTPTVTVTGAGSVTATATVTYTTNFATNGSISAITIR